MFRSIFIYFRQYTNLVVKIGVIKAKTLKFGAYHRYYDVTILVFKDENSLKMMRLH
jgi:hypothetical protein